MAMKNKQSATTIFIGAGTCGLGAGAEATVQAARAYLSEKKIEADIIRVGCIGLCAQEPLLDVKLPDRTRISFKKAKDKLVPKLLDAVFSGKLTNKKQIFGQFRPGNGDKPWDGVEYLDELPFFKPQTRFVLANCGIIDPVSLDDYTERDGYKALEKALAMKSADLCDMVERSGLRGRGGGGFPTGIKWKLAYKQQADQKYMVCNADEGDPGAYMDRAVIEGDPHRLLEGMAIAAYGIGATKGYIYIRAEYPLAIKHLRIAIEQATKKSYLGSNILGTGFDFEIIIKMGAGAFVCGEETALLHSIEGKRGEPRPRPPFPAEKGLFGKPTVINNVETLANLPSIILKGDAWFSSVGTATSKGTKVFALSGKIENTGLVEVAMGTTMRQIIFDIGGGILKNKKYKSVQIGGPSGGCIPEEHLDIQIDYETLKTVGAMMGSGGLVVMDEETCMVDVAKFFMDFIQRESCGKCVPCRIGTKRLLTILENITEAKYEAKDVDAVIEKLATIGQVTKDTSLCGLGQTAPNPVLSTLNFFRHEYEEHIRDHRCRSGVCNVMLTYSIDPERCIGCGLCIKKCPTEAITGEKKMPHVLEELKCIRCGTCFAVCPKGAVLVK
jgi:NADH:ubiquinone oxidoreductase subunit F (NADH-binding)/Pyruvate/2-oxoacid:ferredoxin oxidoreductase delta subunit